MSRPSYRTIKISLLEFDFAEKNYLLSANVRLLEESTPEGIICLPADDDPLCCVSSLEVFDDFDSAPLNPNKIDPFFRPEACEFLLNHALLSVDYSYTP